jgi:hypothetical protein
LDSIHAGDLAGGTSNVLRDAGGRTIQLGRAVPPISVRGMPVRQLLDVLAKDSGLAVQFARQVDATTTITFSVTRRTPAAQVITHILASSDLRLTIIGAATILIEPQ